MSRRGASDFDTKENPSGSSKGRGFERTLIGRFIWEVITGTLSPASIGYLGVSFTQDRQVVMLVYNSRYEIQDYLG